MLRKIKYDPSFWIILLVNMLCIYYYYYHPDGFPTLVWIYWIQSVLIGIFNFLDLLTVRHPDPKSMTFNEKPIDETGAGKGCISLFFLFHYQFFHLVYAIFIAIKVKGLVNSSFILLSVGAIILELTLGFIRNKQLQKTIKINYGQLFMMPYLRIIPMHLMILLPAFLGIKNSIVFLLFKLLADVGMYILTTKLYAKVENGSIPNILKN
ncbi:MAG: DUF6498-containing protein [Chitinophagaceae bacterium]